jgi:hypothetical protein
MQAVSIFNQKIPTHINSRSTRVSRHGLFHLAFYRAAILPIQCGQGVFYSTSITSYNPGEQVHINTTVEREEKIELLERSAEPCVVGSRVCCGYRASCVVRVQKGHRQAEALKVLVECETLLDRRMIIVDALIHARLGVGRHPRLEKVGLPLQRNVLHKVKRIRVVVDLFVAEGDEQSIGDESDVLAHELFVHADQGTWQGVGEELAFEVDGFTDDAFDGFRVRTTLEVGEKETGKVGVEAFVSGDEFVGEGESWHEASFLEPEDGCLRRDVSACASG